MTTLGFYPGMQWTDRDGRLTAEAQRLLATLVQLSNGDLTGVTSDGIQTLTNKTMDGDLNTLSDIGTNSLKTRTGEDNSVVTGTAGTASTLAKWDANGDLVEGPELVLVQLVADAEEAYLSRNGTSAATGPVVLDTYTVATVPDATLYTQGLIYVSDEVGGATPAFSDGTNWRRTSDRATVS